STPAAARPPRRGNQAARPRRRSRSTPRGAGRRPSRRKLRDPCSDTVLSFRPPFVRQRFFALDAHEHGEQLLLAGLVLDDGLVTRRQLERLAESTEPLPPAGLAGPGLHGRPHDSTLHGGPP